MNSGKGLGALGLSVPGAEYSIFRDSRHGRSLRANQAPAQQAAHSVLDSALRQASGIGHHLMAQPDAFDAAPYRLAPEVEINQESGGRMVVTHQVPHEHVHNVVVNGH